MDDFLAKTLLASYNYLIKYNVIQRELYFMRSNHASIHSGQSIPVDHFFEDYHFKHTIHPEDRYLFDLYLSPHSLLQLIENHTQGMLFSYRALDPKGNYWASLYLYVPEDYSKNNPYILFCQRKVNENTTNILETLQTYHNKLFKVLKCNLTTNTFTILKQRPSEKYLRQKYIKDNVMQEECLIEEGLIHPSDVALFKHYTNHTYIEEYFANKAHDELSFFYRRKLGNIYKWVRVAISPAIDFTEQSHIYIYILEDIDQVLTHLLDHHSRDRIETKFTDESMTKEVYHDSLLKVVSYFTQRYVDFYLIDLKKDIYIMYKIQPQTIAGDIPMVGNYSKIIKEFEHRYMPSISKYFPASMISIDTFQNLLKDKSSIEFTYMRDNNQKMKTTCTKIESERGIPTKILCATLPYNGDNLLKVKTFGNFDVFDKNGNRIKFTKKQSKQLLAYLIDRQGFPVSTKDIVVDVLEKSMDDNNAMKYVSKLSRLAIKDLESYGYEDIIIKEWNSLRINIEKVDCDYYHLIGGDLSYLGKYHNEYMKEYSWAEETNAEILHYSFR